MEAVTVYVWVAATWVGLPLTVPVLVSNSKPVGRGGETVNTLGLLPPPKVGVLLGTTVPITYRTGLLGNNNPEGGAMPSHSKTILSNIYLI